MKEFPLQAEIFPEGSKHHSSYAVEKRINERAASNKPRKKRRGRKIINLEGKRFGMLTVLHMTDEREQGQCVWICRCDCGHEILATSTHLRRKGNKKLDNCGCQGYGKSGRPRPGAKGIGGHRRVFGNNPQTAFNMLYASYRQRAASKGYIWKLPKRLFLELTGNDCHYCGKPPEQVFKDRGNKYTYNGVDRVDSSKGYLPDNCVTCCGTCNVAKNDMSLNDFRDWIKGVHNHFIEGEE